MDSTIEVEIIWLPPTIRDLRQEILEFLNSKTAQPLGGVHPPTLIALRDVHSHLCKVMDGPEVVAEINSLLFDLEVEQLVYGDSHDGEQYFGLHSATIKEGDSYIVDPDLICDHCGRVQATGCIGAACVGGHN